MDAALLLLADGRFPAGGHANSAGTESAVRYGIVHDAASLERFLRERLRTTGVVDAAFAAATAAPGTGTHDDPDPARAAWHGGRADDPCETPELATSSSSATAGRHAIALHLDAEYDARLASPRARLVSRQMGRQLLRAAHAVWANCPTGEHHQPVALGLACSAAGGTPADAAALAVHHLAAAICTAAVRMLGLDPLTVAAIQARSIAAVEWHPEPGVLPALTVSLTEILAEDHGRWDARLFVA